MHFVQYYYHHGFSKIRYHTDLGIIVYSHHDVYRVIYAAALI